MTPTPLAVFRRTWSWPHMRLKTWTGTKAYGDVRVQADPWDRLFLALLVNMGLNIRTLARRKGNRYDLETHALLMDVLQCPIMEEWADLTNRNDYLKNMLYALVKVKEGWEYDKAEAEK